MNMELQAIYVYHSHEYPSLRDINILKWDNNVIPTIPDKLSQSTLRIWIKSFLWFSNIDHGEGTVHKMSLQRIKRNKL